MINDVVYKVPGTLCAICWNLFENYFFKSCKKSKINPRQIYAENIKANKLNWCQDHKILILLFCSITRVIFLLFRVPLNFKAAPANAWDDGVL